MLEKPKAVYNICLKMQIVNRLLQVSPQQFDIGKFFVLCSQCIEHLLTAVYAHYFPDER
jgi:hypothetical protein